MADRRGMTLPEVLLGLGLASMLMLGILGSLGPLLRWDVSLGLRRAATDCAEAQLEGSLAAARQARGYQALESSQPASLDALSWRRDVTEPAPGFKQVTITVWAQSGGQLACLATVLRAP